MGEGEEEKYKSERRDDKGGKTRKGERRDAERGTVGEGASLCNTDDKGGLGMTLV